MSAVTHLIKQIRALPYSDMMMVANELRDRIHELTQNRIEAVVLADILARLQEGKTPLSQQTVEEEKVLREIFRRKLACNIQRYGSDHGNKQAAGGWSIEIPTVPGSAVVTTELRAAFPMMLDQIITLHVLTKK